MTSGIQRSSQPGKNRSTSKQVTPPGRRVAGTAKVDRRAGTVSRMVSRGQLPQRSGRRVDRVQTVDVMLDPSNGSNKLVLSKGGRLVNQEQVRLAKEIQKTIAEGSHRDSNFFTRLLGRG